MQTFRSLHLVISALLIGVLAACSGSQDTASTGDNASAASSEAPVVASSPASAEINEALNPKMVNVTLSLEGQPTYLEDEDVLQFNIKIANNGQVDLISAGAKPVNLGASLVGPKGPDVPPGIRDFMRIPLPLIAMGTEQTLQAKLPAESLDGQTVQFQLVQEGVAWFDGFGQKPLNLGAYSRCDAKAKTLCDSSGKSL